MGKESDRLKAANRVWMHRFDELRRYKEVYGDCLVPTHYAPNPKLGRWVMTQRRQYANAKAGKKAYISKERVEELNKLGFTWRFERQDNTTWNQRFEELRQYKEIFGDCLVPQTHARNPSLGFWVSTQRRQYRLLQQRKPSYMTQERAQKLDDLGFAWNPLKGPSKKSINKSRTTKDVGLSRNGGTVLKSNKSNLTTINAEAPRNNCDSTSMHTLSDEIGRKQSLSGTEEVLMSRSGLLERPAKKSEDIERKRHLFSSSCRDINFRYILLADDSKDTQQGLTPQRDFSTNYSLWVCESCGASLIGSHRSALQHAARCVSRWRACARLLETPTGQINLSFDHPSAQLQPIRDFNISHQPFKKKADLSRCFPR